MIVCSDHSQSQGRGRDRPLPRVRRLRRCAPAQRAARGRRDRGLPELARRAGLRARPRRAAATLIPRIERTLLALEGVDLVMRMGDHPDGEAIVRGERSRGVKEVRFAPRGDLVDAARRALERRGRPRPARPEDRGRPGALGAPTRTRSSRVWSRAALPHGGRGARLGPPRLRVPRLGRRAPRRRRLARLAARQRLARRR